MRIGFGYDVHQLTEGRKLILGGETVPYEQGLSGHSDADVLVHAVMDAILGALALGDIGQHFPDTDPAYKDISSMVLLKKVGNIMKKAGYVVGNIDAVVAAEKPKLASHILKMRTNIGEALETSLNNISIKATTTEQLGFVGRREGMESYCVCLLEKSSPSAVDTHL